MKFKTLKNLLQENKKLYLHKTLVVSLFKSLYHFVALSNNWFHEQINNSLIVLLTNVHSFLPTKGSAQTVLTIFIGRQKDHLDLIFGPKL